MRPPRPFPAVPLVAALLLSAFALSGAPAAAQDATPAAAPAEPPPAATTGQGPGPLVLRRVMLSTGGVGYFEYEARVTGSVELPLPVRLDQVDDVLKSIVVYDDHGGIGEISLPGQEPLQEVFRELPFTPEALASPAALLTALRGAEIRTGGSRQLVGRVMAVTPETVTLPNGGGSVTRNRLTIMTEDGLRQMVLEEADGLQFTDPDLQRQIGTALAALAQHNQRDRRTLTVRLNGEGERTVRVAYVAEVPLWKAAYRLVLSDDQAQRSATLQGWAVIENLTGEDWHEVDLTVVAGNPVTFRQALYQAYYVSRPEVPVEVLGRVMPQVDTGQIHRGREVAGQGYAQLQRPITRAPVNQTNLAPQQPGDDRDGAGEEARGVLSDMAQFTAAESSEATTQVLFRLPQPVTVANGHSVLVPLLSRTVPVERVALYQPGTHALYPLATVRVTNDGDSGLPPGVLTIYERSAASGRVAFVGDARLGALPAGERRLVSFALDQRVRLTREQHSRQTIARAAISDGVLRLTVTDRTATTYTIAGAAREERTVMIEHPRQAGWTLVEPAGSEVEVTATQYRIRRTVPAGEGATVNVVLEQPRQQQVELVSLSGTQVEFYAASTELPAPIRAAVARLAEFQGAIAEREQTLRTLEAEISSIRDDQDRVRRNLGSVPRDSDLHQRYLGVLSAQEDRLEQLRQSTAAARTAVQAARQALTEYVRSLTL